MTISGRQFWLWRAVDDEGEGLDLLMQRRRDKAAAVKLMRKRLKKQGFARCSCDRQAALLRRGKVRNRIIGAPRARLAGEQSGRELAPADTTARAQDAAFQIARISPALPVHSCRRPKQLQCSTPSHIPPHASRPPGRSLSDVAGRHRGLSSNRGSNFAPPIQVAVTRSIEEMLSYTETKVLPVEPRRATVAVTRPIEEMLSYTETKVINIKL